MIYNGFGEDRQWTPGLIIMALMGKWGNKRIGSARNLYTMHTNVGT